MSAGKYSPTVSHSYDMDQKWWYKNGGGYGNGNNPDSECDNDGYDSYGYSGDLGQGPDRAGHCEDDYLGCGKWVEYGDDEHYCYPLLEDVQDDWSGKLAAGNKHTV
jgi:hypothetical protein